MNTPPTSPTYPELVNYQASKQPDPIPPTNIPAVLSLVFSLILWPLGIVFGAIAYWQLKVKPTGERGLWLAVTGLVISTARLLAVLYLVIFVWHGPGPVITDGVHQVGVDVQPGTYTAPGGGECYWARLRGLTGLVGDVIANGQPTGQVTVTILDTDSAFQTEACGTWQRK